MAARAQRFSTSFPCATTTLPQRIMNIPSDDEEAWAEIRAHDLSIGYDENFVRSQNSKRSRRSRRYYNDALRNAYNSVIYRNVILCPYPCRFVVMRSIRNCEFPITTLATARILKGVSSVMACVMMGVCEDGCLIRGCHRASWSRCIRH